MIRFDRFPGGKTHAVVFSFDDGRMEDKRLTEMLDKYKLKATFHINSGKLDTDGYIASSEITALFKSHEVALHGQNHAKLLNCSSTSIVNEVLLDRIALEQETGSVITGFSYPYGDVNDTIYHAIRACGVEYARTTNNTHQFELSDDFLLFNPTCHVYDAFMEVRRFIEELPRLGRSPLFFVWGHSFEFERDSRWYEMEQLCEKISNRDEIWYTTCGELCSYLRAVRGLRISADERIMENPSFRSVWVSHNKLPLEIRGGKYVKLN